MKHHHLKRKPNHFHFIEIVEKIARAEERFSLILSHMMRFVVVLATFDHNSGELVVLKVVKKFGEDHSKIGVCKYKVKC